MAWHLNISIITFHEYEILLPSSIIDEELITSEWDEIQRILASIARKDVSQSTIIRKLSSYSRKNRTLKALIEFDKIIMGIYMLKYIDDIQLRRNVHRALNRGEAFHQIRSALFQVNGKKSLVNLKMRLKSAINAIEY